MASVTNDARETVSICRRLTLVSYPSLYMKVNSKQIKDVNIRRETLKLLKENRGNNSKHWSRK